MRRRRSAGANPPAACHYSDLEDFRQQPNDEEPDRKDDDEGENRGQNGFEEALLGNFLPRADDLLRPRFLLGHVKRVTRGNNLASLDGKEEALLRSRQPPEEI